MRSMRDERYKLQGWLEFDEDFFERVDNKNVIEENKSRMDETPVSSKRGRGSEREAKVLVMVESESSLEAPIKGEPNRKVAYLKMIVMADLKSETIYSTYSQLTGRCYS